MSEIDDLEKIAEANDTHGNSRKRCGRKLHSGIPANLLASSFSFRAKLRRELGETGRIRAHGRSDANAPVGAHPSPNLTMLERAAGVEHLEHVRLELLPVVVTEAIVEPDHEPRNDRINARRPIRMLLASEVRGCLHDAQACIRRAVRALAEL